MRILIPYDGSRNSLSALRLLATMALNPNSDILILKVVSKKGNFLHIPGFDDDPVRNQDEINSQSMVLRELASELSLWQRDCNINYRIHFGKPAESILEVSQEWKADLIILGPKEPNHRPTTSTWAASLPSNRRSQRPCSDRQTHRRCSRRRNGQVGLSCTWCLSTARSTLITR
ncbi:MAG: universal stress protein [Cyanobacteriota/Melainabacteria group bacterium]